VLASVSSSSKGRGNGGRHHAALVHDHLDLEGNIRVPRAGAVVAAILRIGIGLIYLWAFLAQGFGVGYTNQSEGESGYAWHFSYDADNGWISSGFSSSPTQGYVDSLEGPVAFIPQELPVGLVDFGWMFAIGGLVIALTLGSARASRDGEGSC
jgi:thiosulfate dehydrogenase (quinone) large subunit